MSSGKPLSICIASSDFLSAGTGGDSGSSYIAMARTLAAAGHHVTCLHLGTKDPSPEAWKQEVENFSRDGLTLVALPTINGSALVAPTNLVKSYETYHWLKKNDRFDIIHFPDRQGSGYHTVTAKHHGLAFGKTTICVGVHSMDAWLKTANQEQVETACEVDTEFMERRAVALADALVGPTQGLVNWISDRGWEKPGPPGTPRLPDAAAQAVQALSINPTDIVALKTLARIHLNAGLPEAAQEACELVLKRNARDSEALQMIAEAKVLEAKLAGDTQDTKNAARPLQQGRRPDSARPFTPGLGPAFA